MSVKKQDVATLFGGVMVRGIFTDLNFPYAHFPTTTTTANVLFTLIWEAIKRLERLVFKVIALTSDGASQNRKFFQFHRDSASQNDIIYGVCFRTVNPYSEDRHIYFIADVPHLIKTTRNC